MRRRHEAEDRDGVMELASWIRRQGRSQAIEVRDGFLDWRKVVAIWTGGHRLPERMQGGGGLVDLRTKIDPRTGVLRWPYVLDAKDGFSTEGPRWPCGLEDIP
jgi:hypothetical protein